jgi:hypothetical protein
MYVNPIGTKLKISKFKFGKNLFSCGGLLKFGFRFWILATAVQFLAAIQLSKSNFQEESLPRKEKKGKKSGRE